MNFKQIEWVVKNRLTEYQCNVMQKVEAYWTSQEISVVVIGESRSKKFLT